MWITLNNVKSDSSTARHGGGDVRYQIIRGCLRMRAAYWRPPRPVSLTLSLVLPPKQPARCSDEIQNSNAKLTFKNYKLFSARSRARFFFRVRKCLSSLQLMFFNLWQKFVRLKCCLWLSEFKNVQNQIL